MEDIQGLGLIPGHGAVMWWKGLRISTRWFLEFVLVVAAMSALAVLRWTRESGIEGHGG